MASVECKRDLNAFGALLALEQNIKKRGHPDSLVLWFLCSYPYADPSVKCKNAVYVGLHNYFLSIIIILKWDRRQNSPGAQWRDWGLILEHNNNIKTGRSFVFIN